MTEIKFKTNVNCNHCINKITPVLNNEKTITDWSVDLSKEDKILSVKGDNLEGKTVVDLLSGVGYIAEEL